MAILLIILLTCANLAESAFIKQYNLRHTKGGFLFTSLVSLGAMLFFLLTDTDGLRFPPELLVYAVIGGALYCSASFLTYVALGCGSFALSMLILSYSVVFSIGYGIIFLGESAAVHTYIGLGLLLISLYLVRADKTDSGIKLTPKWLVCILLAFIGNGMLGVVLRMQQIRFENACNNEFMLVTLGLSAGVLFLVGLIRERKDLKYVLRYGGLYATSAGVLNGVTNMLGILVNAMIPLSIASASKAGVKIILSFAASRLIFKETYLPRQIAGVLLGALALVLLNL